MATMPSPQERPDLYDYYDNGDVTPDDRLAPDVLAGIERGRVIVENVQKKRADEARRKESEDAERATREAEK
jgi:hypothetical protein